MRRRRRRRREVLTYSPAGFKAATGRFIQAEFTEVKVSPHAQFLISDKSSRFLRMLQT